MSSRGGDGQVRGDDQPHFQTQLYRLFRPAHLHFAGRHGQFSGRMDLRGEASIPGTADCWQNLPLEQRKRCCSQDSANCFDEVFTKAECCSNGWAWRFPLPLLEPLNFSAAFQWFQNRSSPVHPALDPRQLKWEEAMRIASKSLRQRILGHDVEIHYFKMATDVAMELADYRRFFERQRDVDDLMC